MSADEAAGLCRRAATAADVILTFTLTLAICLKATVGRLDTFDLGFDDETLMMAAGLRMGSSGTPAADWGPLYSVWYRLLATMQPDPLGLYQFNWLVLQVLLVVVLWTLARRSGAPPLVAAVVTIAWSLSHGITTWPFVAFFSIFVLGLGAVCATFATDAMWAAIILTMALSLATFVRPELAVPAAVCVVGCVAWCVARFVAGRRRRHLLAAVLVASPGLACLAIFGNPLGSERAMNAFEQHYARNRVERKAIRLDPWTSSDRFARESFPHATTILEAMRENPRDFAWHVGRNARRLPGVLADMLTFDAWVPFAIRVPLSCALAVILVARVTVLVRRRRSDDGLRRWLPLMLPFITTAVASALLIYPRQHYLVPVAFFLLAMLAGDCGTLRLARLRHASLAALALLLVCLPTYRRQALPALLDARGAAPVEQHEGRLTVEALRKLSLPGRRKVLEADFSRAFYARLDFVRVAQVEKDRGFDAFLRARDIDIVVLDDRLRSDPRFRDDPEFARFDAARGESDGFLFIPVEGTGIVLAIRSGRHPRARSPHAPVSIASPSREREYKDDGTSRWSDGIDSGTCLARRKELTRAAASYRLVQRAFFGGR